MYECVRLVCIYFYPWSTKDFTRTHSEIPMYYRIELEFGNWRFLRGGKIQSTWRKPLGAD